jgi:hypothetical protein
MCTSKLSVALMEEASDEVGDEMLIMSQSDEELDEESDADISTDVLTWRCCWTTSWSFVTFHASITDDPCISDDEFFTNFICPLYNHCSLFAELQNEISKIFRNSRNDFFKKLLRFDASLPSHGAQVVVILSDLRLRTAFQENVSEHVFSRKELQHLQWTQNAKNRRITTAAVRNLLVERFNLLMITTSAATFKSSNSADTFAQMFKTADLSNGELGPQATVRKAASVGSGVTINSSSRPSNIKRQIKVDRDKLRISDPDSASFLFVRFMNSERTEVYC